MKKVLIGFVLVLIAIIGVLLFIIQKQSAPQQAVIVDSSSFTELKTESSIYGSWEWIQTTDYAGNIIAPQFPNKFVLTITSEGKVTGTTDCNSMSASIVVSDKIINVGSISMTEMACMGEILETVYINDFARATSYSIEGDILTLSLLKDAGIMTFKQTMKRE